MSTLESAFGILPYSVARVSAVFCIFCFIEIYTQRCILQPVLYTPAYEVYSHCVLHLAVFCIPCIALRGSGTRIQKQLFHKLLSRKPDLICLPPPTFSFSDDDDGDWWWCFFRLGIIAAMMMVVNDCWCHVVKYSISTTMIVVFTLIPGIEDTTTRHHDMQSLSKWQLVHCLKKKFSGYWWSIVHNIYEIAVSSNFYPANFVLLGPYYSPYIIMKAFWYL